jgi:hypothetical protein
MEIGERLAAIEATVKLSAEVAARDRVEVKEALDKSNKEIKEALDKSNQEIKEALEDHTKDEKNLMGHITIRLGQHDDLINQGRGFSRALAIVGGLIMALFTAFEVVWHLVKGK